MNERMKKRARTVNGRRVEYSSRQKTLIGILTQIRTHKPPVYDSDALLKKELLQLNISLVTTYKSYLYVLNVIW